MCEFCKDKFIKVNININSIPRISTITNFHTIDTSKILSVKYVSINNCSIGFEVNWYLNEFNKYYVNNLFCPLCGEKINIKED